MTHPIEGGLSELISSLEAASEGSRELDGAVALAVTPQARLSRDGDYLLFPAALTPLQPYTTSIDAAVALIEWKLPGWIIERAGEHVFADHRAKGPFWATLRTSPVLTGLNFAQCHHARSRPLALCIALLKALQDQQVTS